MMTTNNLNCPSCGMPKLTKDGEPAPELTVCFYCYLRGTVSNLKLFILIVLEEINEAVTIYKLAEIMTAHPINRNRREFTRNNIKGAIRYMTRDKNKLILVGHRKSRGKNNTGRKLNTYRISRRKGTNYLKRYLDRWDKGKIVHLKQNKAIGIVKVIRRNENRNKSISIKNKIKDGEYDRFEFLMIRDYVKE